MKSVDHMIMQVCVILNMKRKEKRRELASVACSLKWLIEPELLYH